jgi:reactive intermediate/imine deaminase
MTITHIKTEAAPSAIGSYSQAVCFENIIYLSGQIPIIPETNQILAKDFKTQVKQVFSNLQQVALAGNSTLENCLKLTIFLTDMNNFSAVNTIMREIFSEPFPARAVVEVSGLPKGVEVEIDAVIAVTK